ncbi:hypothetical protein MNBD_PLANCTO02-2474 [hydrothermal vent metagenome]|uniref:Uncharacterized protein n=1 Tax=hydrothermal vent metagenome TaxID=652676 RepID=A0A3B1DEE0_9ZZZZ
MLHRTLIITSMLGILVCPYICNGSALPSQTHLKEATDCCQHSAEKEAGNTCHYNSSSHVQHLPVHHHSCGEKGCVLSTATSISLRETVKEIAQSSIRLFEFSSLELASPTPSVCSVTAQTRDALATEQSSGSELRLTMASLLI